MSVRPSVRPSASGGFFEDLRSDRRDAVSLVVVVVVMCGMSVGCGEGREKGRRFLSRWFRLKGKGALVWYDMCRVKSTLLKLNAGESNVSN